MKKHIPLVFLCLLIFGYTSHAQETDTVDAILNELDIKMLDSVSIRAQYECDVHVPKNTIKNKKFAQIKPQYLKVNNQEYAYIGYRLLKYRNKIIMYTKIFDEEDDVCIRADKNFEIHFANSAILYLEHKAEADCEGEHIIEFTPQDMAMIRENRIDKIQIFAFEKNYEVLFDNLEYNRMINNLKCLLNFKIR